MQQVMVFLMKEETLDFQGFHWKRMSSIPTERERHAQQNLKRVGSQPLFDYGKDSFLGLVADLSTHLLCSRTWWSTFTSHHIFHCKQRTETSPLHVLFFTNCHSLLTLSLQTMLFIQEWLNIFGKPFKLINERQKVLWNKNSKLKLSHAYKINSIEDSESS